MAATMTGRRNNQIQQGGAGMSRWLSVLAVLLLAIGLCGFAIPNPQQQYLVDQTGVMGTDVEKALQSWNQAFAKSGAQIAMAVIPTLDGEDLETTATDTFRSWGVGHSQENNGVLILIVLNERRIRVEVGYGLEEVLPDGLVGRLMREYAYPAFAQNRYVEGSVALVDAIGQKIAEKYQIQTERGRLPLTVPEKPFRIGPFFKFVPLLLILFVVLRRNRSRIRGRGRRRSESSGMGWLVIFEILEALFRNGGGGGRGGFGGGGFGGFGGGSSGGGGASGKW